MDATYVKARIDHQVVSRAVVIATGVTAEGGREVLGADVGDSEDTVFWTAFLNGLKDRGLAGVDLVISDAHRGLQASIRKTMQGSGWQRCRVHLLRNILAHVPRGQAGMVAAFVRTIFAQPDADTARRQLREVATRLERSLPKAAGVLADAEDDVTAYAVFPRHHWRKIWSTNPRERVNKEIKRRTNVVGVFPNDDAVLRLVGPILAEQHDEWQTSDRRYLTMNNATVLDLEQPITLELEAAQRKYHRRGPHRNTPLDGTLPLTADSGGTMSQPREGLSGFDIRLQTDWFAIRTLHADEVGLTYVAWFEDPVVQRFIALRPKSDTLAELREFVECHDARGDSLLLGIFSEDGRHVANLKHEPIDLEQRTAILGVLIGDPAWRGRELFAEVFAPTSVLLRERFGISTVLLGVDGENTAAIAAYERSGFRRSSREEGADLWMECRFQ